MRILLAGRSPLHPSGGGKVLCNVGRELRALGNEVGYLAWPGPMRPHWGFDYPIWAWSMSDADGCPGDAAAKLAGATAGLDADVVILFGDLFECRMLPAVRAHWDQQERRPLILLWLTVDAAPIPRRFVREGILEAADAVCCTTRFGAEQVQSRGYAATAVPLGVDPGLYHPTGREAIRAARGERRPVLGWVGLNQIRKHPICALEALRILRARGTDACLVMRVTEPVGGGAVDIPAWCEELDLSLSRESWLTEPGRAVYLVDRELPEDQMGDFYRVLDLLLVTSGAGAPEMPVLEAQACGVPVVGSVGEGVLEAMPNGSCTVPAARMVMPPGVWQQVPNAGQVADIAGCVLRGDLQVAPRRQRPWSAVAGEIAALAARAPAERLAGACV